MMLYISSYSSAVPVLNRLYQNGDYGTGVYFCTDMDNMVSVHCHVYSYELNTVQLRNRYNIKMFHGYSVVWLDFMLNRAEAGDSDFDMITGPMLNDIIRYRLNNLRQPVPHRKKVELVDQLNQLRPVVQVCIRNGNILNQLMYRGCDAQYMREFGQN